MFDEQTLEEIIRNLTKLIKKYKLYPQRYWVSKIHEVSVNLKE